MLDPTVNVVLLVLAIVLGLAFALLQFYTVSQIELPNADDKEGLVGGEDADNTSSRKVVELYGHIRDGAKSFLFSEYSVCMIFVLLFSILVFVLTAKHPDHWDFEMGGLTAVSYVLGAMTSMLCGYIGMMIAVYSNARTTIAATKSWGDAFHTAFRAGCVMGFALCSIGLAVLLSWIGILASHFGFNASALSPAERSTIAKKVFEIVAGFGLGASTVALFGRVGGGIYTKAADVGADLAGKVIVGLPEDDPRNPATIADNVGDNVGDVAGMGADLFGSLAEATCAALIVSTTSLELVSSGWTALLFPLSISGSGIVVCVLTALVALHVQRVNQESDIELVLKVQLALSAVLLVGALYLVTLVCLPSEFTVGTGNQAYAVTQAGAFACTAVGVIGGCCIGFVTEYFTSHSYGPVREVAHSCETGAATNIIFGLSLGYKSIIIPICVLAFTVYISFYLAGMYGISLAALGMLGTLAICLTIDVYGPVCDNAGGIAEMASLPEHVREKTDALDAAGNTTAAIGKGFAIGSAALVSLALFGAFITRIGHQENVNILRPVTFSFLFIGAMLPYWFTAMTMKSVGLAAKEMVIEVARQFRTIPGLLEGTPGHGPPDHARCIKISTDASLREMILPGVLVIFAPIVAGTFFGVEAVSGLLVGSLTSGVQLAISQSNSGGAWDNAKKLVEKGGVSITVGDKQEVQRKGSELHKAAVVGDTVGDPLKDTSGPALNILMKLMAIISLVFADFFMSVNNGHGLFDM